MKLDCYWCGSEFEAAPQARYCSTRCRRAVEKRRARRRDLESRLEVHRLALEVAELDGDRAKQQYHRWHAAHIERRLDALPL